MIKLNLIKIAGWGVLISASILAAVLIFCILIMPNLGESALVWMIYISIIGGIAQFSFFGFMVLYNWTLNRQKKRG